MKDYTAWMNVTEEWKVSFQANNLEEAKEILRKLNNDELDPDDVPEYFEKNKGIEKEYVVDTLEEWDFE